MKTGLRAILAVLMVLLLGASALGCSLVTVNEEKDMAQIAAKIGDIELTKGEVVEMYEMMLPYASMYGYDTSSSAGLLEFANLLVDDMIYERLYKYQARQKGFYNFSEEAKAAIEEDIQEEYNSFLEAAATQAEAELAEDPDIDVEARKSELLRSITLSSIGEEMNAEELLVFIREYFEDAAATEAMVEDFNKGISVSEEEVRAAYDTKLASEKETLTATPGDYKSQQESADLVEDGVPVLYTPEGYRRIRVISIYPEDEISADYAAKKQEISDLTMELGELSRAEDQTEHADRMAEIRTQLNTLEADADKLRADFLKASKAAADEAYTKLEGGGDFKAVMLEYGMDDSFTNNEAYQEKGKLVSAHESLTDWPAVIKAAALAITEKGGYSQVLEEADEETGSYGYHIVQYVDDEPAGERSYDAVRVSVEASALEAKQDTEWEALVDEWMLDSSIITRYDNVIASITA